MKKTILFLFFIWTASLHAQSLIGTWYAISTTKQSSQYGQPDASCAISFSPAGGSYFYGIAFCGSSTLKGCANPSATNLFLPTGAPGQIPLIVQSVSNGLNTFSCGSQELDKASEVFLKMFGGNEPQNTSLEIWVENYDDFNETCTLVCVRDLINGADGKTYTINLSKNSTANLEENNFEKVSIYPNPTNDNFTINVSNDLLGKNHQIADFAGRVIAQGKINSLIQIIDLQDVSNGSYLLQIDQPTVKAIKLIKQ